MILDDLNKTRQMMLKNSGASRVELPRADPSVCTDPRSLAMLAELNGANHPTTWVANSSTYNNPILPVFPRFEDDPPKKEESTSNAAPNA
ncbi:hypothetical protein PRIPAC_87119 [Pristionchus pacificus]|uniref:Uncharacterized protein n=1 Tax=Pristionchus pacificus TaxID=54126 RepID=A0A454Y2K1_PRIPA|nr:hypothetical protein PRIPAC_87119 [Pristionchus pacificus]|eukprot:PDM60526.1 hypothetical protein PRIPAC_53504 [Pristionchus pacificus]